jgi:hypothetical protein
MEESRWLAGGSVGGGIFQGPGNGTGEETSDRVVGPFDGLGRFFDTCGDNRLSAGYPEFYTGRMVVHKPGLSREKIDVAISRKHQGARIVQSVDGGLESVASNGLVLEWGMSMPIQVASVPKRQIELP